MSARPAARSARLRDQLGAWLIAVCGLPLVLFAWSYGMLESRHLVSVHQARLDAAAQTAAAALDQYLKLHLAAIEYLADDLSRADGNVASLSRDLASMRRRFPGFLTMLRTDADGYLRAVASGRTLEEDLAYVAIRNSVADRSYFQVPRDSGRSYVSDVFQGRGLGTDIIVAIASPVYLDQRFAGVVQGSLRIANFDRIVERLSLATEGLSLDVVDRRGAVVYSNGAAPRPLMRIEPEPSDGADSEASDLDHEAARYTSVSQVGMLGWQVIVRSPGTAIAQSRWQLQWLVAAIAVVGMLAIWLAIGRVVALVARPLELIKQDIDRLDVQSEVGIPELEALPAGASVEVHSMREGLLHLAERLSEARRGWMEAMAARARSHADLERVVADRENHIARQTDELKRALAAAEAASVAKDQLLANTSHEIRTPLNGIIGTTELLLREDLAAAHKQRLRTLLGSAEGLMALLNDLLDLARADRQQAALVTQAVVPAEIVESVLDSLRPLAEQRGLQLLLEPPDPRLPARVMVDPLRLRQILLNLTANAIKFTEVGSVRISVEAAAPGQVRFSVIDTGIGIRPEDRERIFEPFVQVDASSSRRFQGTGLGLTITRHWVNAMGGELTVENAPGGGSCFSFSLPLEPAPEPVAATETAMPEPVSGFPRKVLVVDDVEVNRDVALAQLLALGMDCAAAEGGAQAVAMVAEGDFDLILLDCQMPEMDGYATAAAIRRLAIARQPKIAAMTANAQPGERERCLAAGMDDYLSKPVRLAHLRQLFERLSAAADATGMIGA
ncbi:MAG: ATP-binding protein [Lysobacterales bacterium]